jgi:hypothetical protein
MHVETLAINDPRWVTALGILQHDWYHLPSYLLLEAQRIDATPEALLISDKERMLFLPYLVRSCNLLFPELKEPLFDVVSPYGYPGILLNDAGHDASFASEAMDALRGNFSTRGFCSAFLRMHPILGQDFLALFPTGTFMDSSETVAVDLAMSEADWLNVVHSGHQRIFKKIPKSGFSVRVVSLTEAIDPFMGIYKQTMDRVHATNSYYFDHEYFEQLALLPGIHCCVVDDGPTAVAACIFSVCGGIVELHLGGTLTEFLSKSPFSIAIFHIILWSKRSGHRWVHLGGGVGGKDDSLLRFKSGFSNKRFQFLTSRLIIDETKYSQLVHLKALAANVPPETVHASNFFPAYRG